LAEFYLEGTKKCSGPDDSITIKNVAGNIGNRFRVAEFIQLYLNSSFRKYQRICRYSVTKKIRIG
jgi:hypothetical protein